MFYSLNTDDALPLITGLDIAKILGITPPTVTFHLERIVKKLGASRKNQAISLALKQGMVRLKIDVARVRNIDDEIRTQGFQNHS